MKPKIVVGAGAHFTPCLISEMNDFMIRTHSFHSTNVGFGFLSASVSCIHGELLHRKPRETLSYVRHSVYIEKHFDLVFFCFFL